MRGNTHSRADEGFGLSVEQVWNVHHNATYRVQQCSLIPIQEPPHSAGVVLNKDVEDKEECDAHHQAQACHACESGKENRV